MAYSTNW